MAGRFVDISAFQPEPIDWNAYKAWSAQDDGISRVAMRSSHGVGFKDAQFDAHRANALAGGIDQIIYYHYGYPQYNAAVDEANWCHSVIGAIRPQDQIVLDFEEDIAQATGQWALAWLVEFGPWYGKIPGIYSYPDFIANHLQWPGLNAFPLWYANWTYNPDARPPAPAPWTSYEALQYSDKAQIPGIPGTVDADIFISSGGTTTVNTYGPNSADFNSYFSLNSDGNWTCTRTGCTVQFGNKALFQTISTDGNTLPIIGLPRTNELYQHDSDGYAWSVQFFERGVIVYDPVHRQDSQPGLGASYFGKYSQFQQYDPAYKPSALSGQITSDIINVNNAVIMLMKDAGV